MTDPRPAIVMDKLGYHYGRPTIHRSAFHNLTLTIKPGEFLSILGPSGCGKSTLLRILAHLTRPTTGQLMTNYKKVAMIFQGHGLFPWLTVLDNVAFGLKMAGVSLTERDRRAKEKLREVGLEHLAHRHPHELSGGEHQRVAVARALAIGADLLLMDEPFSSLDSITAQTLKKDILAIWERYHMTVILVSHLIPDAVELSDRVVVFTAAPGTIKNILPINLARPRATRSSEFFQLVDQLSQELE